MNLNKYLPFLTRLLAAVLLTTSACSKLCNSGYEGSRCNILTTDNYTGTWAATDTPGNLTYTDTVTKGSAINDITFSSSFAGHHFNHPINASVLENAITIPYQQPDSGGNFVQGTGTLSNDNNRISLNYQIISAIDTLQIITNYTGAWTRQN